MAHKPIRYPFEVAPEEGQAIEVAPGVLWMRLPLPMALNHVNVYAIKEQDGWCIVDTGYNTNRTRKIWSDLLAGPLGGEPVTRVILTHHHPDHVGLVGWFQTQHNAELWTTRTAWLYARMLTLDVQEKWPEETISFYRSSGMDQAVMDKRLASRPYNYSDVVHPMPLGFRRIQNGDVIQIGERDWRVRTGGGHAPEHATLWSMDDDLVIAGDQLLPTISPNIGVYATEPLGDPVTEWLNACEAFKDCAQERHFVLCGHKLPFTGLPARIDALIENHHSALARLEEFCKTPRSASDCFSLLFKRTIDEGTYGLALVESLAHLNHLYLAGRLNRHKDEEGVWRFSAA